MRAIFSSDIKGHADGQSFRYEGEEFHHLKNVIRLKIEDEILILGGDGIVANGVCKEIHKKHIVFQIVKTRKEDSLNRECVIAKIKRESLESAIRSAVELGVNRVHIVKTEFSQNFKINQARIRKIVVSAMLQSNNSFECEIVEHSNVEDVLKYFNNYLLVFDNGLKSALRPEDKKVYFDKNPTIFIGPEGGFSHAERSLFDENLIPCHFFPGPILRAETALVAGLSFRYL